ncbi:hypothetical protein NUACC21_53900 [Scytonema sp. NUACC21]
MVHKILVIEDTASTRNLFVEGISSQGFYTLGAENGIKGVYMAQQELPDLIISDIVMPKLDGYGVLRVLRRNPATAIIPFIFVSAKATRADIRKGMEMGADDYVTKPCSIDELVRVIKARLEKQAYIQKWYTAKFQPFSDPAATVTVSTFSQEILPHDPELSEVFQFIEANYQQSITLSDVAVAVGYSPAYLTNLVRRRTGKSVQNWIIERRIAAARSLLLETSQTVDEIAALVGYQNRVHFFRQFREYHGTSPQAWRKQHRCYRQTA